MGWRLGIVLLLCAASLFYLRDHPRLDTVRGLALDATALVFGLASAPSEAWRSTTEYFRSRESLREENARLRQENLAIKGRTQRLAAVTAENARYRALLNSAAIVDAEVMVAEVIAVAADPVRHMLVLDKGSRDGVNEGQPLLGADGLMGQIVLRGERTSRALLITDATHAVPVQVLRNGVRGLAEGTGDLARLVIRHIAATTDIKVGDSLVTSGLGGRFPPGYPVAEVVSIDALPGDPFATVTAKPMAALDRGRHVMLARDNTLPTVATK